MRQKDIKLTTGGFDQLSEEPEARCDLRQGQNDDLLMQLPKHGECVLDDLFEGLGVQAGERLGGFLQQGG